MAKQKGNRMIANNKKAYHDYFIEDKYEAGISLAGTEVKSLRMGKCSIKAQTLCFEGIPQTFFPAPVLRIRYRSGLRLLRSYHFPERVPVRR